MHCLRFGESLPGKEVRVVMRKVVLVVMIATLLLLAFSVPAMAKADDPEPNYGQFVSFFNSGGNLFFESWQDYKAWVVAGIEAGYFPWEKWSDYVAWQKDHLPLWAVP